MACLAMAAIANGPISAIGAEDERMTGDTVITNMSLFWQLADTAGDREYPLSVRLEINFYDPVWGVLWVRDMNGGMYLGSGDEPLPFQGGQVVDLDGYARPGHHEILWDRTTVTVVEGAEPKAAVPWPAREEEWDENNLRLVEAEALVAIQESIDSHHERLVLAIGDHTVQANLPVDPSHPIPVFEGAFVRIQGVFALQRDVAGRMSSLELWVNDTDRIELRSWLSDDERFETETVEIVNLPSDRSASRVRVAGTVHALHGNDVMTVRDGTGQVRMRTPQSRILRPGERVEVIGYPEREGIEQVLREVYVRSLADREDEERRYEDALPRLGLSDLVREMGSEEAARGYPVRLQGMVAWRDPADRFLFVLDASGGLTVLPPEEGFSEALEPGVSITVVGRSHPGRFVPAVEATEIHSGGPAWFPEARQVTLEQLLTGAEYGNWVEVRAVVRSVVEEGPLARLELTAPGGDFYGWIQVSETMPDVEGAVVRIRGICDVVADDRRRLSDILLWIPDESLISVVEPRPVDLFDAPERSLSSLFEFGLTGGLQGRVRVSGVVTLHRPSHYFYLQEGDDAIRVLVRNGEPITPGERLEIVGFPGRDGGRVTMREVVYRKIGEWPEPEPLRLNDPGEVHDHDDGRIVRVEGTLVDLTASDGETRLTLQSGSAIFEARWYPGSGNVGALPRPGALIGLTGVYQVERDSFRRPYGFNLVLRSENDIEVLKNPSWWTASRALGLAFGLLAAVVTTGCWGLMVSRRNQLLDRARNELQSLNEGLESRVRTRTLALTQEIEERKKAEAELMAIQKELIEVSRLGGMAEIATSILHNVGNVLNTVNVSANLISDGLRRSRVSRLAKVVALLREHDGDLAGFLGTDPQGRRVLSFLEQLSGHLESERDDLRGEVESLRKSVEHIKEIVAMQQAYARVSDLLEDLSLADLVEDSLRMEGGSLERHGIAVIREFEVRPVVMINRHKTMQILVNLLRNARQACDESGKAEGRIRIGICADEEVVRLTVEDNGVGISPENAKRIFSHGFSTRAEGNGFGLHSSALFAQEMGGSLSAHSDGIDRGARFTLEIPRYPNRDPK